MSPEQARGKPVDKRADIWAFGVVLFELLSGRRLFSGETISETLAEVLKTSPPWTLLPADTPAPVRRLLRRALEKDPDRRLRSIADACLKIDEALGGHAEKSAAVSPPPRARRSTGFLIGAILGAALLTGLAAWSWRAPPMPEPLVFDMVPPDGMTFGPPANVAPMPSVSPDGRHIALVLMPAVGSGPTTIWVRSLSDSRMRVLSGTENAQAPFWSPDSQHLGYFADNRLKRVAIAEVLPRPCARLVREWKARRGAATASSSSQPTNAKVCFASRSRRQPQADRPGSWQGRWVEVALVPAGRATVCLLSTGRHLPGGARRSTATSHWSQR